MASCLGCCCAPCKPRYRRLVDAIYPEQPDQGLVKANMQKLTFYACSHPEKLDRIGDYLVSRLSRDLYRLRLGLVKVSVEAMDQLLQSCHGSLSLNLFVESFLKMVQKLLETNDPELEMLATESFVNFANIEEDTPSYHRRYDFFISKFSSMCHRKTADRALSRRLRFAGLRGLRGVVWKTVSDDLQANIWEKQHMEKIVPSILYNMHDKDLDVNDVGDESDSCALGTGAVDGEQTATDSGSPKALSDQCLRELMGKASFGSMRSVLQPVLRHCDLHNLWIPPAEYAISSFRAIMYSIQTQYSYVVIQALIGHLDERGDADATTRIGIASVLSAIVPIAGTSIGPSLLEIFNSLLRHLRSSVEFQLSDACPSAEKEKLYQETLINAMGDFANSLPDYQKVEIMMFTIGKVPALNEESMKRSDAFLQHVLVKTLLKVATKYRTGYLATVLTSSFLGPLLKLAHVDDAKVRLLTQQILHTLIDRHANLAQLQHVGCVSDVAELQLTVEKSSRADQMFMKKNMHAILSTLYRSATSGGGVNSQANMDAILCTLSLLCVEVGFDEVLVELFRLVFGLQTSALDHTVRITAQNRARIHNLVAKYLNLSSQLLAIPALCQHIQQVIKSRSQRAHPALDLSSGQPADDGSGLETIEALRMDDDASLLFDKAAVADALRASGKDVTRLSMPFAAKATPDSLLVGGSAAHTVTDGGSASLDMSVDSSPGMSRDVSRRNTVFTAGPR
uniref:Uncharacterized protein n=1 Tax=Plectus sambesii TaxID=2011161 RepID=A0A914VNN2_9BILA